MSIAIKLQPEKVIGALNPHFYGATLEPVGQAIYGGLWAEMLKGRKFAGSDRVYSGMGEGLNQQHPHFGVVQPWEAVNPNYQNVLYVHDNTTFYSPPQAQRISIRHADGMPHGIQQKGLILRAGQAYQVRLVLKGEGQAVRVQVGDQIWQIPAAPSDWTLLTQTLTLGRDEPNGAFHLTLEKGTLWLDSASLMPANHIDGFRADVIAALKEWQPPFLRYPGGNFSSAYHWKDGVGERDRRACIFDQAWQSWEPNDLGTDEFIKLCRLIGAEPMLTVNAGDGTPEEAAAWVEYCNGTSRTANGARRAALGNIEPYNVKLWCVGNEQFGNWQVGHCDAETYAQRFLKFAQAMRAVDPNIELIGVGVPADLYGHWNELVLKTAAKEMAALSVHYLSIRTERLPMLPSGEQLYLPKVAAAHEVALLLDKTLEVIAAHSNPPVPIAFTEWNTVVASKPPDFFEDYTMSDALYVGGVLNACLKRCDRVVKAGIYSLINVMGAYRVTPQQVWKTPSTLVLEIFTQQHGIVGIGCQAECDTLSTPELGNLPAFEAVPMVDVAATYDPEAKKVFLSVVNRNDEEAVEIELEGVQRAGDAELYMVSGATPVSLNTDRYPYAVFVERGVWDSNDATLPLPPHSVTMICFTLATPENEGGSEA